MTERHVGCDCQLPAGGWRPGAPPSKEAASPRHPPRCTHSRGGGVGWCVHGKATRHSPPHGALHTGSPEAAWEPWGNRGSEGLSDDRISMEEEQGGPRGALAMSLSVCTSVPSTAVPPAEPGKGTSDAPQGYAVGRRGPEQTRRA